MHGFILMSNTTQDDKPDNDPKTIYCMHCGTAATVDDYACDRCGERVYVADSSRVPPLGFTSCQACSSVNEAHASYCAVCAAEIDQSARISPDGAAGNQRQGDGVLSSRSNRDNSTSDSDGGGYRIGTGSFRPSQWGLPRRSKPSRSEGEQTPEEIQRWNWSAFILGPIWGLVHGIWWSALGFLPFLPLSPTFRSIGFVVLVGVMLILGLKGNEMAWRARQWDSAEKFLAVQQRWATWSIVFAIGALIAFILFLVGQG